VNFPKLFLRVELKKIAVALENIPYIDNPEFKINEHESTEMPFRYVTDKSGKPILPEVSSREVLQLE